MNIPAGLSAAQTGLTLIKSLRDLLKKPDVDPGEVSSRLLELQELMLDARTSLSEAQDENRNLLAEIERLKRMADFGDQFVSEEGMYWHEGFPYCPICWDTDRKPVRLGGPALRNNIPGHKVVWTCAIHGTEFTGSRAKSLLSVTAPS